MSETDTGVIPQAAPNRDTRPIGTPGEPARVIAFASGGFDTAMDLGVIHALLVSQARPPEAVVGISAGAINAVALAEVLQAAPDPAGFDDHQQEQQRAQVSRFREILERYANAPGEFAAAYLPDTLQVDARRPLEPMQLPIQHQVEREGRKQELRSRQGLIRFLNFLLSTQLSIATLTRFIRGFLGVHAASNLPELRQRVMARASQWAHFWHLVGQNIDQLGALGENLLWRPLFRLDTERGIAPATAAEILYANRTAWRVKSDLFSVGTAWAIAAFWTSVTLLPLVLLGGLALPASEGSALAWWIVVVGVAMVVGFLLATWHLREARLAWRHVGQSMLRALALVVITGILCWAGAVAAQRVWPGWFDNVRPCFAAPMTALPDRILLALNRMPPSVCSGLYGTSIVWLVGMLGVLLAAIGLFSFKQTGSYLQQLLAQFDIADALLSKHPLKEFFVRLFDPTYYGPRDMDDIVARALHDRERARPATGPLTPKIIGSYDAPGQAEPIAVGLAVANVATGNLEIVPRDHPVVDGLYAASAVAPFFPPAQINKTLVVDGANISTDATASTIEFLRHRDWTGVPVVHIYSAAPLPFSSPTLREDESGNAPRFHNAVDVARRALLLERFRDATLERRVTELYTKTLPAGAAATVIGGRPYLRAWVTPIEPDRPLEVHQRLFDAKDKQERREVLMEAVAEGCRASLQVMIRGSQPPRVRDPHEEHAIPCRPAVQHHLGARRTLPLLADLDQTAPAESDRASGLPEICRHCRLQKQVPGTEGRLEQMLHFREWETIGPAWPHRGAAAEAVGDDARFRRRESSYAQQTAKSLQAFRISVDRKNDVQPAWPATRGDGPGGRERPLINLLFSGGVFRGVYQLGTLNALSELGIRPDVVAGASVGSITAAMTAQALSFGELGGRRSQIARLAGTYLALDRLILTDRFADFIRGLTLRAGASDFSLSEADRVFRRFDQSSAATFSLELRRVVAGLERLFWLSPFELHDLIRALRLRDSQGTATQVKGHIQEWLDRMGVGGEILGAEPLALLILEHVLRSPPGTLQAPDGYSPTQQPFDRFLETGIYFLATTTNLSMGRLELLGEQQFDPDALRPRLLEGLLASSAFPAVFRPRWAWEVWPGSSAQHQYIDGGVMDNLPLDGVVHFLRAASKVGLIARRPVVRQTPTPHLLLSASLETRVPRYDDAEAAARFMNNWPALNDRVHRLRYNKKIAMYAQTQATLRRIHNAVAPADAPLDIAVMAITPQWLPGTFAFHPMLGFRRDVQAKSIAHGCATTLAAFADAVHRKQSDDGLSPPIHPDWLPAWGIDPAQLPRPFATVGGMLRPDRSVPTDHCWFRPGHLCPFSRTALAVDLDPRTREELASIHQRCGEARTHRPNH